ncbi:S-locus-specific glycoprotein S13-like [Camellia sinensis]|uniref:S-locus-specific glycoprotein S13-like n=1 Tax=Camellia sinensis TaxID=4442 RepID=UPI0010367CD3|nr:S-locus-specific glycoprotein S13-like [Camellia sinensis]
MIMGIILLAISYYLSAFVLADDMLNQYQQINDSGALVSARGDFKLGFFSTSNSRSRYLGIWYNNIPVQTIVWVANRDRPLNDSSGGLKIGDDGNLILLDSGGILAWSTGIQNISSKPTVAQLLDNGNLVLRNENGGSTESYISQSFDHPSDTLIAGMKLGWDLRVGLDRYLTSWKSADDPSLGDFSYVLDRDGLPQTVIRKGSVKQHRSGIWNGLQFNGAELKNSIFNGNFIDNSEEVYYEFDLYQQLTRLILNCTGTIQCVIWNNRNLEWVVIDTEPSNPCENYGHCGPNSICTISNAYICSCLDGYIPKSSQDWNALVWDGGCVRKYPLNCSDGEGFVAFEGVIVPDLLDFWMNTSMTVKECELECFKNCSCTAYANSDTAGGGSGCLLWYGDLIDIRSFPNPGDQTLYIRVTPSK